MSPVDSYCVHIWELTGNMCLIKVKSKGRFLYNAVSRPQDCSKRIYTLLP